MILVPGAVEQENEELKEAVAMLHIVIEICKKAKIEGESNVLDIENDDTDGNLAGNREFQFEDCEYKSSSMRGLKVHVGKLHKEKLSKGNINLISL